MKFRAFALGAAVAVAVTGGIPATAMASGPPTTSMGTGASAGAGASAASGASASVNDKTNVNVSVVTQLPRNYYWDDKKIYDNGRVVALPKGYNYTDGGVMGPDDHFYFAPSGQHEGVVIAPMRCQNGKYDYNGVKSGNWLGNIVDSALKACAGVYDAAYGIISNAFGGGESYSGSSSYGSGC